MTMNFSILYKDIWNRDATMKILSVTMWVLGKLVNRVL